MTSLSFGHTERGCAPTPTLAQRASRLAAATAETLVQWRLRAQTRKHLAGLDGHLLRDIGLDRATASAEADKPFWR